MQTLTLFPSSLRRSVRVSSGVYSAAIPLIIGGIGGLAVSTHPSGAWGASLASVAVGVGLLLWGIRVHDLHLWQSWWRGKRLPLFVQAGLMRLAYAPGSIVAGIRWQRGFSHLILQLTNTSRETLRELNVLVRPEYPIIDSRVRCELGSCRIGPRYGQPTMSFVTRLPNGDDIATPATQREKEMSFTIDAVHRLYCDDLPMGGRVEVDIASVRPSDSFPKGEFWKPEPSDPRWITLEISWKEGESRHQIEGVIDLSEGLGSYQ